VAIVPKAAIDTKATNEISALPMEIPTTSISNVNEEAKNNFEAITPIQVQYINIDTDEEDRSVNIANLEIDGAKFRELSRKITTLFKRNKPENDKYK
jgi:FlaG/FlaF family flagellin (archaellin)